MNSEGAWTTLLAEQVRANARLYFRIAHRILNDVAAAEDVCQLAFLRACERRAIQTSEARSVGAWLTRVVINESLQVLRRHKVERRFHLDARRRGGADVRQDSFLRDEVEAALAELPDLTRAVVVLRIMQGLSGNEVSALIGCSPAEVSRRLYAGMEQLRTLLSGVTVDLV